MRKLVKKGENGLSLPSPSLSLIPGPFGYTSKPTLSFDTSYADNLKKSAQNLNNTISNSILSLKLSDDPEKRKLGYDMGIQNIKSEVDRGNTEFENTLNQYKFPGTEGTADKPSRFSKLMNSKGMNIGLQTAGIVLDMVPSMDKTHNENDQLGENIRGTVENALIKSGNPYAMAAGVASKIIGKTGGFTDGSKGLGTANDTLNTIASFAIPGAGWFTKKTKEIEKDGVVQASSGYTGVTNNVNTAAQNAGAKILFGRNKANAMIANAIYQQDKARDILDRAEMDRYASANPLINQRVQMQLSGGYNPLVAKDGTKLYNIEFAKRALSKRKKKREETVPQDIEMYKSGGSFNVIPEGALHKNKHHLEDIDSKFEDVTSKGIPVISESEGGDITQHAEVEKEEIIFRLEVTKKLEELARENTDDAALEAGKLLVKEILYNTIDKTNSML